MFSMMWLKDTAERAVSSFAGAILTLLTVGPAVDVRGLDFAQLAAIGGGAALVTVLKAIVASRVGDPDSASLVK